MANLVPNPSAATNTDGWDNSDSDITRITSTPEFGMPPGHATAFFMGAKSEMHTTASVDLPDGVGLGDTLRWSLWVASGTPDMNECVLTLTFKDGEGATLSTAVESTDYAFGAWKHLSGSLAIPDGAASVSLAIDCDQLDG